MVMSHTHPPTVIAASWQRLRRPMVVLAALVALRVALAVAIRWHGWIDLNRLTRGDASYTVVDRRGEPLRQVRLDGGDRRWVPLHEVSPRVISAVIATEDHHFHAHDGVDRRALARAAVQWLIPGYRRSGASTITQQLVKMVYGRPGGLWGKPVEIVRAMALETRVSKDEILEQYLNRIPMGNGIEGVARACEAYFGHDVSSASWSEAALLAGLPQAPSATEPREHLARALSRRNLILARLRDEGVIDRSQYEQSRAEPVTVIARPPHPDLAARFVDLALSRRLPRVGRVAATSLDAELQRAVEPRVYAAVQRWQARGVRNGAAVVLSNATGEVLAYVGAADRDGPGGAMDLLRARRQPGSTLKSFIYERLFEQGATPATMLADVTVPMHGARGSAFEARDYDGRERGPVLARTALASSLNLAALDAASQVGADAILIRLRALGFDLPYTPEHYGPAIVLGGADVTPLEMAEAYATLARGGTHVPARWTTGPAPRASRVMDPDAAWMTWDVLSDAETRRGAFGRSLSELCPGVTFALKTGTSSGWRDAWTAVASRRVTVVVWLGDPHGAPMAGVSGFEAAAPVAVQLLALAEARPRDESPEVAVPSPVIVPVAVCAQSGLRAGPRCAHVVEERLPRGHGPTEVCAHHTDDGSFTVPARFRGWIDRTHPAHIVVEETTPAAVDVAPRVIEPRDGARWLIDAQHGVASVRLRATVGGREVVATRWTVDGQPLAGDQWAMTAGAHEFVAWVGDRPSAPSHATVTAAR